MVKETQEPTMAKEKRTPHKVVMTEGKREIIRGLLSEYDIHSAQDIQEALKDLLGGTIKEMMKAENVRKRHDNTPNIRDYRRYIWF